MLVFVSFIFMRDCRHKKGRVPSIVTLTATGSIRIVKGGTANLLTIREGPAIAWTDHGSFD